MQCLHPIILPPSIANDGHIIEPRKVPCGKCAVCLRRKGREWYVRLKSEYEWHDGNAYFVTLTYSDWCLPTTKSGIHTVCKQDVQKFFKRLRRAISPYKIRYFLISEYGEDNQRPHYHMILYGFPHHLYDIEKCILNAWSVKNKHGYQLLIGNIQVDKIVDNRLWYLANYMCDNTWRPAGSYRNFMLSSRRPGLGSCYLTPEMVSYHRNNLTKITSFDGKHYPIPRFLSDKIFDDDMKSQINEENEKRDILSYYRERIRYFNENRHYLYKQECDEVQRKFNDSRKHVKKSRKIYGQEKEN